MRCDVLRSPSGGLRHEAVEAPALLLAAARTGPLLLLLFPGPGSSPVASKSVLLTLHRVKKCLIDTI